MIGKVKSPIFTYTMEDTKAPTATVKNVIFIQDTLDLVIVWSSPIIQHFNVTSNTLLKEITSYNDYLNFSYSSEYVIYSIMNKTASKLAA